jgi:hypothetical protein
LRSANNIGLVFLNSLLLRLVFPAAAIALAISYRDRFDDGLSWADVPPPK